MNDYFKECLEVQEKCSDPIDQASQNEDRDRANRIRIARAATTIIPDIDCANTCGTNTPHGKACTFYKDCLEDWELRTKKRYNI
jgi:hypothetical protein